MIRIDISEGRGRGVFAETHIPKYKAICVTYSWEICPDDILLYEKTSIGGYWFHHPDKKGYGIIPCGPAGFLNHSPTPNAKLTWRKTDLGYVGILVSHEEIEENKEIFIDYGIDMPKEWI